MQKVPQISASWKTYDHPVATGAHCGLCARRLSCLSRVPFGSAYLRAAGAVLDGAALVRSAVDIPTDSQADLCIRAGYLTLRYIAAFFRIPYNPDPAPDDPISVSRVEFEAALDEMAEAGVPLKTDREQVWRDFVGWRVNYDTVLLALAELMIAPPARWSSDRRLADAPATILHWRKRHKLIETHEWIPPSNT